MTSARVIGLGQRAAGDDGVGLVILERLRALAPGDVELVELAEPCGLIPLLATPMPTAIVDAVVTDHGAPGAVVDLDGAALPHHVRNVSTHGVGLAQALALARLLADPGTRAPSIRIIGVTIAVSAAPAFGLSAAVAAAVPRAVQSVLRFLGASA